MPPTPFCTHPAPKSLYKGEPLSARAIHYLWWIAIVGQSLNYRQTLNRNSPSSKNESQVLAKYWSHSETKFLPSLFSSSYKGQWQNLNLETFMIKTWNSLELVKGQDSAKHWQKSSLEVWMFWDFFYKKDVVLNSLCVTILHCSRGFLSNE